MNITNFEEKSLQEKRETIIQFLKEKIIIDKNDYKDEIKLIDNSKTIDEIKKHLFDFYKIRRINGEEYYFLNASIDIV